MNDKRRRKLSIVLSTIYTSCDILEEILQGETEAYENMPESFQDTINGCLVQENIEVMEEVVAKMNEIIKQLKSI